MRLTPRILFGALLALCWSGLATANPRDPTESLDPSVFRALTNMQLDAAFETVVSQGSDQTIYRLCGPSSMTCEADGTSDGIETCVVTTIVPSKSMPAARANF
jgi:hypothetical protein